MCLVSFAAIIAHFIERIPLPSTYAKEAEEFFLKQKTLLYYHNTFFAACPTSQPASHFQHLIGHDKTRHYPGYHVSS